MEVRCCQLSESTADCSSLSEDRLVEDADEIARLYRAGYGDDSIDEELDGWADEGAWPEGQKADFS